MWTKVEVDQITSLSDLVGRAVVIHDRRDQGNGVGCGRSGVSTDNLLPPTILKWLVLKF